MSELTKNDVKNELAEDKKEVLEALDLAFKEKSLPSRLDLAITGSQGLSITALIGLTAECEGLQLTRQLGRGDKAHCSAYHR